MFGSRPEAHTQPARVFPIDATFSATNLESVVNKLILGYVEYENPLGLQPGRIFTTSNPTNILPVDQEQESERHPGASKRLI